MNPSVAIIILNWNNAADTLACLESVFRLDYPNAGVLVVDNGSTDDSVVRIRERYPELVLLLTGENLGYAGGNNAGIRRALDDGAGYILVLNNDIVIQPDALSRMLEAMRVVENCGIATPLIADFYAPDHVWTLGARLNRRAFETLRLDAGAEVAELKERPSSEVEIAPGSALLITREVCETVGLMDEAFFLYNEETEWCIRVREHGFRIIAVPGAVALHKVSASLRPTSPVIDYYMVRNGLRLAAMHSTGLERLIVLTRMLLKETRTILAYTVKSHHGERLVYRDVRLRALADAARHRWGKATGIPI